MLRDNLYFSEEMQYTVRTDKSPVWKLELGKSPDKFETDGIVGVFVVAFTNWIRKFDKLLAIGEDE